MLKETRLFEVQAWKETNLKCKKEAKSFIYKTYIPWYFVEGSFLSG